MSSASSLEDTIVAPATAAGEAAVGIVRLSGPRARTIGRELAPAASERQSHRLYHARLRTSLGEPLDEGLVVEMHAPRSYTGEDVVELQVHGSHAVLDAVLDACLAAGARLAEPGEFTLRAFLRGRLDLAQAEAVGDLISATSEAQRRIAVSQLGGTLSHAVTEMLEQLEGVLAGWRALLDFPEQVGDGADPASSGGVLAAVERRLAALVEQARVDLGRRRHVALCGAPNVGKSSLLNSLLGERRVLVDAAPGTTRDPVEVELVVAGARLSVWDTAGLRREAAGLEREGIDLAWQRLERADVVVWLAAADAPLWPPPELSSRATVVVSKSDLAGGDARARVLASAAESGVRPIGFVSSRTGEGLDALRALVGREAAIPVDAGTVVVRERHRAALLAARDGLGRARAGLAEKRTLDVLTMEVEGAARQLGLILGRDVDLEVLDRIFADFCLGK